MRINLLPSYSLLAEGNSQLSWHQEATKEAIADPNIDIVINTAVTGDGKSYAAFGAYPDGGVLAMYPTNELVRDQERQLYKYYTHPSFRIRRLTGADLEDWANAATLSKADTICELADSDVLLTNPDLFYYLHQGNYLEKSDNRLSLWHQIDRNFKALIFDEFHLLDPPQVSGILSTIILMRCVGIEHKYIFLSATPNPYLIDYLEQSGLKYKIIDPVAKGAYATIPGARWRPIAKPTELYLVSDRSGSSRCSGESWIEANKKTIANFFHRYPNSKGAIILNSIASVRRVKRMLESYLPNLKITENSSIVPRASARKAIEGDLIVGTSCLDVGIDFKINFLIFEGQDAPSFSQRLGRLGRHSGFPFYKAIAVVPKYLIARIAMALGGSWQADNIECDRISLSRAISREHRQINNLSFYYKTWSPVQALLIGRQLLHPHNKGKYHKSFKDYEGKCEQLYGMKFNRAKAICLEWKEIATQKRSSNLAIAQAKSFRGDSTFNSAAIDCTDNGNYLNNYSLTGILSNCSYQMLSKEEFVWESGIRENSRLISHCHFFFKIFDFLEKRRQWNFYLDEDRASVNIKKLNICRGVRIIDRHNEATDISKKLASIPILTFIVDLDVEQLKASLLLPTHFPVYPLATRFHDTYHSYSVGFDLAALILDSYLGCKSVFHSKNPSSIRQTIETFIKL